MLVFFHPIILGSMPTSAASNPFFLFLQSPFVGDEGDELPIFCWNSSLCGWNQPKYPPLRTHADSIFFISKLVYIIGLKFVFLPPKDAEQLHKPGKWWRKSSNYHPGGTPFWHFRSEEELQRLRANAGAAWSGAPVGSRWSWWLMVTTGYHWNFTMISWRFHWNFTTK